MQFTPQLPCASAILMMTCLPNNLDDWLQYQRSLNPQQISLGLERLRPVAQRMHLSAGHSAVITVAGTNGKGSTVALLESLLCQHAMSSASYTSPWLLRYNESVRVDGQPVADEILLEAFERVEAARADVPLTEFESRTLAAAYVAFAHRPDVVIFEVGLGGRLDAVNIFDATVAIVTSIALDHQQWLGATRADIAREKVGIARHGAPLISADSPSNDLIAPLAHAMGATPWLAQDDYHFGVCAEQAAGTESQLNDRWWFHGNNIAFESLPVPALGGLHQLANAAASMIAFSLLGKARLDVEHTSAALLDVQLMGRIQQLSGAPQRFVDVAHNPQAAAALGVWAQQHRCGRIDAMCAMYADKDLYGTAYELREVVQAWHLAALPPPRGASLEQLQSAVLRATPKTPVTLYPSIEQAWNGACAGGAQGGFALGFGSFETVREILSLESATNRLDTGP
ncbi:MAG: dihydrofolate synthase/folylpolyglutamate synthase [Gammaproteobacteria bacterium]